jgi:hypothetical protein
MTIKKELESIKAILDAHGDSYLLVVQHSTPRGVEEITYSLNEDPPAPSAESAEAERDRLLQRKCERYHVEVEGLMDKLADEKRQHKEIMDEAEKLYQAVVDDNQKLAFDLDLAKKVAMDNGQVPMSSVEDDMELLRKELEGK